MQNISLIPTTQFEHGTYPFEYFNYLQSLCYPLHTEDSNQIIAAATSAGKTVVAELNIAYTIAQNQKAAFLSPLKAVTQEKYDDWLSEDHYFSAYNTEILTGDYKLTAAKAKNLQDANLVLLTSEMLDTRTRYLNNEDNSWLLDIGTLVVDEAHLLSTNRGPALEVGLMRFAKYNPQARIILLSATMSNTSDLKKWLEGLNNKTTEVISTQWRPVHLEEHYIRHPAADITKERINIAEGILDVLQCSSKDLASYLTSPNETSRLVAEARALGIKEFADTKDPQQTLVFVHGKEEGRKLCSHLKEKGVKAQFHNADLKKSERNKLEEKFRSGEITTLVATSTLAWGINMPARNVIIMGNKRGFEEVDDIDIKQMLGRAGRFGMYNRGDAFVVCNYDYYLSDRFEVNSQLANKQMLMFHLIAEVYTGMVRTQDDALEWFDRSLASTQAQFFSIQDALTELLNIGALKQENGTFKVTRLGKIARDMYLSPTDIYQWKENFNLLAEQSTWLKQADVAWALTANTTFFSMDYTPKELKRLVQAHWLECSFPNKTKNQMYAGLLFYRLNRGSGSFDKQVMREMDSKCAPLLANVLKDIGRVFSALQRIDQLEGWNREKDLLKTKAKIMYGVSDHLLELVSIPGVGETIAVQLHQAGLKTLQDVKNNRDNLGQFLSRKASVTRVLKGLDELESSNPE